jgi:putative copper export protein
VSVQVKPKTPRGIWALRAVTITIALVVILVVGTIGYSAYEDYSALRAELSGGSHPVSGTAVPEGVTGEKVLVNITVENRGLYSLNVTMSCTYPNSNVVCQTSGVVVPAGQTGVLHFTMTVSNLLLYQNSKDHRINGTVGISMPPFVSLKIGTDFSTFVNPGGG